MTFTSNAQNQSITSSTDKNEEPLHAKFLRWIEYVHIQNQKWITLFYPIVFRSILFLISTQLYPSLELYSLRYNRILRCKKFCLIFCVNRFEFNLISRRFWSWVAARRCFFFFVLLHDFWNWIRILLKLSYTLVFKRKFNDWMLAVQFLKYPIWFCPIFGIW